MRKIVLITILLTGLSAIGQNKYLTKTGLITFEASVPSFEEVAAKNQSVTAILNAENGEFAALALVKAFRFNNALMEEHFNENYAESDEYPKTIFKGMIANFNFDSLNKINKASSIDGSLTFHGVTVDIEDISITLKLEEDKILISGSFKVLASDFNIEIPKIVKSKLSNEVDVRFSFKLIKK